MSQQGLRWHLPEFDTIGPLAARLDELAAATRFIGERFRQSGSFTSYSILDGSGAKCAPEIAKALCKVTSLLERAGLQRSEQPLSLDTSELMGHAFLHACKSLERQIMGGASSVPGLSSAIADLLTWSRSNHQQRDPASGSRPNKERSWGRSPAGHAYRAKPCFQERDVPDDQAVFNVVAPVAGLPALSLPVAAARGNLRAGVQLVGPHGSDLELISLARTIGFH